MAVRPAMAASESPRPGVARVHMRLTSSAFDFPESDFSSFEIDFGAASWCRSQKGRGGIAPVAPRFFALAGLGAESALLTGQTGLAGDPSEVTALGIRHWITSFRC
jgi:hypothetical protein